MTTPTSSPAPIRLIIFDCDGVLVDSEPLAMRVLLRALANAGLDVSAESGFRTCLGITGLMARLHPTILSATMVEHGKPAPDLFLKAARDMGVTPSECVVIEDSP